MDGKYKQKVRKCVNGYVHNHIALGLSFLLMQTNHYRILGKYAAMSITQGGSGFPFLDPAVYMYLCNNIWSPVPIPVDSLPDPDLKLAVMNVCMVIILWCIIYYVPDKKDLCCTVHCIIFVVNVL